MMKVYNFISVRLILLGVMVSFTTTNATNLYVNNTSTTGDIYCTAIGTTTGIGTTTNPFLTLNAALAVASNGDTIFVDSGSYTGVGNKSLTINKAVTIIGAGSSNTIFTSHTDDRFATISANNVHIQGLQLFDFFLAGTSGIGQVILVNPNIIGFELTNIVVKNNYGDSTNGESIYLSTGSSSLFNGLFFSCSGFNGSSGGAVKVDGASLVLQNSVFNQARNSDGFGGAIQLLGNNPYVTIDKTTFIGNSAKAGGAISQVKGTLIVTNSCFNRNYCQGDSSGTTNGGGHYFANGTITSASFTNCKFEGAFFCASTNPTEYPCQFSSNVSNDGNAISIRGAAGNFSFDTCDFNNSNQPNANFDNGLDFYLDKSGAINVVITNCKFANDMWGGTGTGGSDAVNIWNEDLTSTEFIVTNSGTKQTTANQDGIFGNNYSYAVNLGSAPSGNDLAQSSSTTVTCISGFAGCTTVVNCTTETNAPIIISCAPNQTLSSCTGTLPDYRPLLSVFDDCSVVIVQSPVPGTLLSSLGNGNHTITFTVSDQSPNSPDATCTMILTLSGCVTCSASLSYSNTSVCKSAGTQTPTFSPSGGTFSSTTGLTINPSTGIITPSSSTVGTYTVTYTPNTADPSCTATFNITIVAAPNAGSNGSVTICSGATVTATQLFAALGGSPQSGGSWSPALAGAGTYIYTVSATSPCTGSATATVTVTEQTAPNAGSNGSLTICSGSTVTATQLFAALGGSPQSGGSWSPTLAGAGTYIYTVSATSPCTGSATATVTVTEQSAPNAGSNGIVTICSGSTVTATQLFGALGGSPQSGGSWSPALAGAGTYIYTVSATSPCTGSATATVTVTEQTAPNAGSNGSLTICSGSTVTATQLFTALGGSPQSGGSWSPALAGAGTYTYTVWATSPCTGSATATVTVTEQTAPNAGSNGSLTICLGSTVTATQLFTALGGSPQSGGSWSPTLAGAGTYTYTISATSLCTGSATATVTVTEQTAPNAGSNGSLTICLGATVTSSQLFGALGGSPQSGGSWSPALAGAGTYTYTVSATSPCTGSATATVTVTEQSAPNAGSNGSVTICSGATVTSSQLFGALGGSPQSGGSWSPALAGAGTYTYTVSATSPCTGSATATVTVTEQSAPNAGSNGSVTICSGATVTSSQLFTALGGSPQSGGSWSPTLAGAGTYTYTISATSPCTGSATATVTVTEQSAPNAGSNGSLTICSGSTVTATQLFTALGGSPQSGGSWSPTLAGAGTYTYTISATSPCSGSATATVTVTEQSAPNAGSNGSLTICSGSTVTATQLFTALGGSPQSGGSWSPTLAGAGTYIYTVSATSLCTGSATATVTVTEQSAPNAGSNGSVTICSGATVTATQLFTALGGSPQSGGSWSPTLAGAGTYTYTVSATSPCTGSATSTVTVTEQSAPNAGSNGSLTICSGSTVTATQLFTALGGSPQSGGSWSPALAGAGTYTYTISATSPCTGSATATVTVTEIVLNDFEINSNCNGTEFELVITPIQPNVIYSWYNLSGDLIGNGSSIVINVESFYEVKASLSTCFAIKNITIDAIYCDIPKGISPNGDGFNDFWDLTNLKPTRVEIFNRYGIQVYSRDNYRNEWNGNTNKGQELPSATYYYIVYFVNGVAKTGWVYLNREN